MCFRSIPKIIAVCGAKRCGKDTLAMYIQEKYGFKHVKISSQLKQTLKVLFSFTDDQLESDIKDVIDDRWNVSPRQAMQFFGTEIMQYEIQKIMPHVGRSFWIKGLLSSHPNIPLVISDLRFKHEIQELKTHYNNELLIVKIDRGIENKDVHVSEQEYKDIQEDVLLKNNLSIHQMFAQFDNWYHQTFVTKINQS
jgi:hypothetical protein